MVGRVLKQIVSEPLEAGRIGDGEQHLPPRLTSLIASRIKPPGLGTCSNTWKLHTASNAPSSSPVSSAAEFSETFNPASRAWAAAFLFSSTPATS